MHSLFISKTTDGLDRTSSHASMILRQNKYVYADQVDFILPLAPSLTVWIAWLFLYSNRIISFALFPD